MEIIIVGAIIIGVLLYTKTVDGKKFIQDNQVIFEALKEDDYDFLVAAKYGESVDPVVLYTVVGGRRCHLEIDSVRRPVRRGQFHPDQA